MNEENHLMTLVNYIVNSTIDKELQIDLLRLIIDRLQEIGSPFQFDVSSIYIKFKD